jgi:hypothetical protein
MMPDKRSMVNVKAYAVSGIICFLMLSGCASTPMVISSKPEGVPGVYHRVEKGQTLWTISKIYNMDLEELARVNRISDAAKVEAGQQVFIPFAQKLCPIPEKNVSGDFIWPLKGRVIGEFSQTYGNMINKGVNIQPSSAGAEVVASRSGRVVFYAPDFDVYGKTVILDHGDGFMTVYARNAEVYVKPGDRVEKGSIIARAGSAGRDKAVYLHFEIRKGYLPQNPNFYLP